MDLGIRRFRYGRRVIVAAVLAVLPAIVLYSAGLPISLVSLVSVGLPAGYWMIDALMGGRSAETLADTGKFVLLALALSLLWGAALFGIAYLLSR
jgi:hypothetical protein